MPVVAKNEPVLLDQCPICEGYTLYVIERFTTLEDRKDFSKQVAKGYSIERMDLQAAGRVDECVCSEIMLQRHMAKKVAVSNTPKKAVLSLGNRRKVEVT